MKTELNDVKNDIFFLQNFKKKWKPKKRERSGWEVNLYPSTRRRKCRLNSLIFVWERISSQLVDLKQSTISFLHKIGCHQFIDNYSTCVQARENFTRWWRNHFKLRKLHVWNKSTAGAIYKLKTWKKPKKKTNMKNDFLQCRKNPVKRRLVTRDPANYNSTRPSKCKNSLYCS